MFENKIISAPLEDTAGIKAEAILTEKELSGTKRIKVILETSSDGKIWWEDQSLIWEGPYAEYPIIEPNTIKGQLYRIVVEHSGTLEAVVETRTK